MHTDRARVAITGEEPPTCTHTFTQRQEQELEGEKEMGGPNDQGMIMFKLWWFHFELRSKNI